MNFRQKAANSVNRPSEDHGTLEHQAEQAARLAGKSVEAWLQDVINEQTSALNAAAHHGDAAQHDNDYVAKSAVLNELVDRVRHLEQSFEATNHQQFAEPDTGTLSSALDSAARNLNKNYDEDARALIEGIRARAQGQNQLPPNPVQGHQVSQAQHVPPHSIPQSMPNAQNPAVSPQDVNADRMLEMLGTLGYLEQQLKANLQQANAQPAVMMQAAAQQPVFAQANSAGFNMPMQAPAVAPVPTPAAPASPVPPVNNEDTMRLSRLEEQLARMEKHLTASQEPETEPDDDPVYRPKRNRRTKRGVKSNAASEAPILSKSSHKMGKKQGGQALREAMDTIVEQHTNDAVERTHNAVETGDTSPLMADQAQEGRHNMDRRETDKHFQTLMAKIEALNTGATDPAVIESLKGELSALKGEVTAANAQTSFAGQHIQEEVKRLRTIIAAMPDGNVNPLLGSRLETMETDVNRIAEFLLKSPDLSAVPEDTMKLQSELNRLSDGLLAVIDRTEKTTSQNSDLVVSRLQGNLTGLRDDIMSNMQQLNIPSNVAGAVSSSLEDRFNKLRSEFDSSLSSLGGEVTGLGSRLKDQVSDLSAQMQSTEASLSALNGEVAEIGSGLKDQVSIISAQVHSATERLEALGNARNGDAHAAEKISQMEGRLVKAAERLEAASMDAASAQGPAPASLLQLPVDLITEQSLRSELGEFASSLGPTLETALSSTLERSVGKNLTASIENNQSAMVKRIDEALAKLDTLTDKQDKMIEDVARRTAEKTAQSMGSASIPTTGDAPETATMLFDLGEIRSMANTLLTSSNNSFMSIHGMLDGVAGRLEKLEQQGGIAPEGDPAPSAALASELQDLRTYMSSMKTSTDDLSTETRSSFHSVQDMLSRVSERLEALEANGSKSAPLMASENIPSVAKIADEDVALPKDEINSVVEAEVEEEPAIQKPSAPTEEEVMQRMREHVKSREPDAPVLIPDDNDMPTEPGSGRPINDDVIELSSEVEPAFENTPAPFASDEMIARHDDEQKNEHEDDDFGMDVEDQMPNNDTGSKSDFIHAARRAAQAAAAEQALQLDDEPEKGKSALSAIRERINKAARGGRKSVLENNDDLDAPSIELDEDSAIEPNLDAMGEKSKDLREDLVENLADEKGKNNPLRTALLASVCVAIISVSGYLLKDSISALFGGSPTNTAAQQAEPKITTKPAVEKKAVQQEVVKPAVNSNPNPAEITSRPETVIDLNATSLPPSATETEEVDDAQIVDPSTTQSITRQLDFNEVSPQSGIIRDAMKLLPKDKVSDKLSDALLEGDPAALLEVGRRYGDGEIFERDLKKSAFWYEQSAANGSAIAKFRLGTLYEDGVGVAKNPQEAKRWYIESADLGNARAMHNLAVLHAEGALGRPDFEEAFKWFEKGANHGIKDSQFNVGILYVRGLGVEASLVHAYKWFDVVAKIGDRDAAEKRDEIVKVLTKEQLKEAKVKSAAYKAVPIKVDANVISPSPDFWLKGSKLALGKVPNGLARKTTKKQGSPQVKEAQVLLNGLGFDTGGADGLAGKRTKDAIRAFEYEIGMPQTGRVNKNLIQLLKSQKI
ncbi:MAG: peptidoglycan-binding protein [Hyphomicrobiales bacterium]